MERIVPWPRLLEAIDPYYLKGERDVRRLVWNGCFDFTFCGVGYGLSDEGPEDALHDGIALRAFAGIDLAVEDVSAATTL
jgi:IS5 family transposase